MNDLGLDYFYGSEADQFSFYRLPKILFTDARFSKLSAEAKILYGLMLDRMSLSIKNGWIDEENHVYIYFKLEDALDMLNIGKDKEVKLVLHSDRGSQYTSEAYRKLLKSCGIIQSLSGTGRCYDNARMESFFATLKKEKLYQIPTYRMKKRRS